MFPGAGAHIYKNEAGEVTGWDYPSHDETEGSDPYDDMDHGYRDYGDEDE